MAKESMPFELKRPNAGTPVTNATEIDWGDKALPAKVNEMSDAKSVTGNSNSTSIEGKVNALIDCLQTLIQGVVFHSGTPFVSPEELSTSLELLRYPYSGNTSAICGQAICGQAICGTT